MTCRLEYVIAECRSGLEKILEIFPFLFDGGTVTIWNVLNQLLQETACSWS